MRWTERYRAYDDATLSALANPGLLRRALKDVEAGKVGWSAEGPGAAAGVVVADGQAVQLDARGPQQARCACPAPGLCKHILGAVLWLRGLPAGPAPEDAGPAGAARPAVVARDVDEAASPAGLDKAASPAGVSEAAPPTDVDEAAPPTDLDEAAPPTAASEATPPTGVDEAGPPTGVDEAGPPTDVDKPAPPPGARRASPPPAPVPADPLADILALEPAGLFKAAGIAALRRAAATPLDGIEWQVQGAVLVIELPALGQRCRWVAGAGFAGMVSDVPASERKAVHLIAIAAVRQAHGRPLAWPESARPAPVADDGGRLGPSERAFLGQVEAMLHELLDGGLSHVSELTSARLLALGMSARGEGLPRVAALLRGLGGIVDLLVRRDHRADERDALAVAARLQALCVALAEAQGALAIRLRGRLRRDFDEAAALELLPLGAHWWQTRGGARGLTLAFWDVGAGRLLQATLARPDSSDGSFTRHGAWSAMALWPGAGSAQRLCEGLLRLEQPRLAEDGRLALAGVTRARTAPPWQAADARWRSIGCADWGEVALRLRAATGLAGEPFDAVLLRPADHAAPVLDEVRQQLAWPLQDSGGRWLQLVVPVSPEQRQRLDNLDRLMARRVPLQAVLVRIERAGAGTSLIPVALLSTGTRGELLPISLDFAEEPPRSTSLSNRILRLFEARRSQAPAAPPPSLAERLLAPVIEVIETQAATGRLALGPAPRQRLEEARQRLDAVGLASLAAALGSHLQRPAAAGLLQLSWLCQLAVELDGLPPAP